jgi:predicted amidohydrolase
VACSGVRGPADRNLEILDMNLRRLRAKGVRLALFPEGFLTGYTDGSRGNEYSCANAARMDSRAVTKAVRLAKKHRIYASVGMWEDAGVPGMSQILMGPEGVLGHYRKAHPAEGYGVNGTDLEVVDLGFCRVERMP